MKAKKIIAIGLVAAMTLGMSTSVLAQSNYEDYSKYPVFDQYGEDNTFGPYDNAFHANGQGWLESGTGINESAVNVIVPVTPTITLGYADPGLFDFGVDPQRLVKRTNGRKYANRIAFTPAAKEKGVYFIRPKDDPENKIDGDEYLYSTNYFDTSSVKYKATNIGTKNLELYVTATLSKGSNFDYLTAEPELGKTASAVVSDLIDALGEKWAEDPKVVAAHSEDQNPIDGYDFLADLMLENPGYSWTGDDGVFTDEEWELVKTAVNKKFSGTYDGVEFEGKDGKFVLRECMGAADNLGNLYAYLENWTEDMQPSTGSVGMYMTLNTRTTDENGNEPTMADTKAFTEDDSTEHDAIAETHLTIEGNPDNYETDWDEGTQSYRYKMKSQRTEPFQAAQFWFEGASTYNASVPTETKIPKLDFTYRFSQKVPEPPAPPVVEDPKLVSVNEVEIPTLFDPVFPEEQYGASPIVLGFDLGSCEAITTVKFLTRAGGWSEYDPSSHMFTISGNTLTANLGVYTEAKNLGGTRTWRIYFDNDDDKFIQVSFTATAN